MSRNGMIPVSELPLSAERIAKMFRVPYWLIDGSRPSWLRRPIWRLRAVIWRFR